MIVFAINAEPPKRDPLFEEVVEHAKKDEAFKAKVLDMAARKNLLLYHSGVVHLTEEALTAYYESKEKEKVETWQP